MPVDPFESDPWDAIDEPTPRGARVRRDARLAARGGRVTVEVPPYIAIPEYHARWGESGPPPVGTVLSWSPIEQNATFVAVCTGEDEWVTTDPGNRGGAINFTGLARMIANAPCKVAVDWRPIPTVEARPAGDEAVKDWASQFIAPQASAVAGDAPTVEGH